MRRPPHELHQCGVRELAERHLSRYGSIVSHLELVDQPRAYAIVLVRTRL